MSHNFWSIFSIACSFFSFVLPSKSVSRITVLGSFFHVWTRPSQEDSSLIFYLAGWEDGCTPGHKTKKVKMHGSRLWEKRSLFSLSQLDLKCQHRRRIDQGEDSKQRDIQVYGRAVWISKEKRTTKRSALLLHCNHCRRRDGACNFDLQKNSEVYASLSLSLMNGRTRFPFTATQWQELEHQALIFKYMVSGLPIPPDLIFTVKRSLESSLSSKLILHQPQNVGWDYFQMGFGKKIDPEPGRCRRTDGKKWRCSKEAYPDSKYCERHMHRGRNRSRKPVEIITTPSPLTTATNNSPSKATIPISSLSKNQSPSSHSLSSMGDYSAHPLPSFLYSYSSSSRPPGTDFPTQETITHLDSRYGCGMRERVDEHAFFSDNSGTVRSYSASSTDEMGSSLSHLKQRNCSVLQSGYPFLKLQGLSDTDFKSEMPLKIESDDDGDDKTHKVMHHFLDECPKNRDSWLDSGDKSSNYVPFSTTHLSISTPNTSRDFFMAHDDK